MNNSIYIGTVLPGSQQRSMYPSVDNLIQEHVSAALPKTFNGVDVWKRLINYNTEGVKGGDWAYACKTVYLARFNIGAYKNVFMPGISETEMILMIDKQPRSTSNPPFGGYTIYDGLEYSYLYGFTPHGCFNKKLLLSHDIDLDKIKSFDDKLSIVNKNKDLLDRSHCLLKYNDKFLGRRVLQTTGIINIGGGTDLKNDVALIKAEIFRFGPVIAGMFVYEDFVTTYDGLAIYTGPSKSDKKVGGHSVCMLGWGVDQKFGEYWILANNFGRSWGEGGLFRMKIGVVDCELEKNVVAPIVNLPNSLTFLGSFFKANHQLYLQQLELEKTRGKVNPFTFYTGLTTRLIQQGILAGRLGESVIDPLIINPENLINQNVFMASNINNKDYATTASSSGKEEDNTLVVVILLVLFFMGMTLVFYEGLRTVNRFLHHN